MKRLLTILLCAVLLIGTLPMTALAEEATAATMRLEKCEGTVTVKNASGKTLKITEKMRLYNGYEISTARKSYAYISLDGTKAIKLDASTKVSVTKAGKKLEILVSSGKLLFDVSAPLDQDESLDIRTSTSLTGVRGTIGYVEITGPNESMLTLLEGVTHVTTVDPVTGEVTVTEVTAGQQLTSVITSSEEEESETITLVVTNIEPEDIPGFVLTYIVENPEVQERIEEGDDIEIQVIITHADEIQQQDEEEAEEEAEEIQQQVEQLETDEVDPLFEEKDETPTDTTPVTPSTPAPAPVPSFDLDNPDLSTLIQTLSDAEMDSTINQVNVTNASPEKLTITDSLDIPAGETLQINSGSITINQGGQMAVNGTMNVAAGTTLTNSGTVNILSANSLHVAGTFTNSGMIQIGQTSEDMSQVLPGLLDITGTLNNNGSILIDRASGSKVTNSGTFNNSGNFTIHDEGVFTNTGTYNENRTDLCAMVTKGSAVSYIGPFANLTEWPTGSTIQLIGGKTGSLPDQNTTISGAYPGFSISGSSVTLDLNGRQITSAHSLVVLADAVLTIKDTSTDKLGSIICANYDTPTIINKGTFNFESGTVEHSKTGTALYIDGDDGAYSITSIVGGTIIGGTGISDKGESGNYSKLTMTRGTVNGSNIALDASVATGPISISGGILQSSNALVNASGREGDGNSNVTISGNAVLYIQGDAAEMPIQGAPTFTGGKLRADTTDALDTVANYCGYLLSEKIQVTEGGRTYYESSVIGSAHTVIFVFGLEAYGTETQSVASGSTVAEPDITDLPAGYRLIGWYTKDDTPWNFATDKVTKNLTLYAKYEQVKYEITLNVTTNDTRTTNVPLNGYIEEPTDLPSEADGYCQLLGWCTEDGSLWSFETMKVTGPMTLTAHWKYVITFDFGLEDYEQNIYYVEHGTPVDEPTDCPVREGYVLEGWCTDPNDPDNLYEFADTIASEPMTFYAVWKLKE